MGKEMDELVMLGNGVLLEDLPAETDIVGPAGLSLPDSVREEMFPKHPVDT